MANNRPRKDSYIIFGVEDATYDIVGVENNENRRNQQGTIDILKKIAFSGGVRPRIEVHTIIIENHEEIGLPSLLRRTFDILPLSKTAFSCVLHYPYFRLLRRDCYANHKILPHN